MNVLGLDSDYATPPPPDNDAATIALICLAIVVLWIVLINH